MHLRSASLLLALLALSVAAPAYAQTPGVIARESVGAAGKRSLGQAGKTAVSADGRFVAFQSDASDLVPGDTNRGTDVFVRDRTSGVLQRVSLTWNGGEARGDSMCPALSADGRYVAFASQAWNMVPGGTNIGHPRWDVYVHDRQAGTTVRVSVASGGGDANGDSECPAISGDGQRVAFASDASNLDDGDDNGVMDVFVRDLAKNETMRVSRAATRDGAAGKSEHPSISGNGRFVAFESSALDLLPAGARFPARSGSDALPRIYVRDLQAEETQLVSIGIGEAAPDEASSFPSISADGQRIAFISKASNLITKPTLTASRFPFDRVFVRDRTARTTWLASPTDPGQRDCGRDGKTFPCWPGGQGPPSLSADGRFVTFSSRSLLHLPANQSHGDQVYLFDNVGRRLRRLSVDPSGVPGTACSWSPALSGDGRVLAYASKSTNLVPDDGAPPPGAAQVDVFSQAWTCDDAGRCRPLATCPAKPASCAAATSSLVRLRKHPPGGRDQDELYWRWSGAPGSPFPDPGGAGTYQLCVYAGALALDVAAPEAPACAGAPGPCWRSFTSGYKLLDAQGGITDLTVSAGAHASRISLHGKGALLDAPYLPLAAAGIVVQLQETGTGQCWGTEFPASSVTRNIAGVAQTGSRHDGWLVAEIR